MGLNSMSRLSIAGFWIALNLSAQPAPVKVSGSVVNSSGGALRGVRLSLVGADPSHFEPHAAVTETRADGTFVFETVRPGRYLLEKLKVGFVSGYFGDEQGRDAIVLQVRPGAEIANLRVSMEALAEAASVSGRVTDTNGVPIPRLSVQLLKDDFSPEGEQRRSLVNGASASTDTEGLFRLGGIPAGTYYLSAKPITPYMQPVTSETWIGAYYGGTSQIEDARRISISAGENVQGLDLQLVRTPLVPVEGRLLGARSVTTLRINALNGDISSWQGSAKTADDGSFRLMTPPGSYILSAFEEVSGKIVIAVPPGGITGVSVPVQPVRPLSGRVSTEDARIAGISFSLQSAPPGATKKNSGILDSANTFSIPGVGAWTYSLIPNDFPDGWYMESARLGSRDVLENGVDGASLSGKESLVVTVKRADNELAGTVFSNSQEPLAGATVTMIPDSPRPRQLYLYQRVSTDPKGRFVFENLAPGAYRIHAWQSLPRFAERNEEFIGPYRARGTRVEVVNGRKQDVRLKVTPR